MPRFPLPTRVRAALIVIASALVAWSGGSAWARPASPFEQAVIVAVSSRSAEVEKLTGRLAELLPDPEQSARAASARDPQLTRAFRAVHAFLMTTGKATVARVPVSVEQAMADAFFAGFFGPEDNPEDLVARVGKVADRLSGRLPHRIKVKVGILGGGGIMAFARGGEWLVLSDEMARWPEDELAAVVAHEIAHLAKRDYVLLKVAGEVFRQVTAAQATARQDAYKILSGFFVARFQRFSEYETDVRATDLLRRAGYDPRALLRVLDRLDQANLDPRSYLKSDHPSTAERAAAIRRHLARTP